MTASRCCKLILFVLITVTRALPAAEPDWDAYERVLKDYLAAGTKNGVPLMQVDYRGLRASGALEPVVRQVEAFRISQLESRGERLAFYINAYNILAIDTVLNHWPVDSIKDAGSLLKPVWKQPAGLIGGKPVTLDALEHQVLRPLGEARIHFAIVCASVSCPDLRAEAYTAARLDGQIDDQVRGFLRNGAKGLRVEDGVIRVSQIFDWFAEDFESGGGVAVFIRRHLGDLPPAPIRADIPYDWSLNSKG